MALSSGLYLLHNNFFSINNDLPFKEFFVTFISIPEISESLLGCNCDCDEVIQGSAVTYEARVVGSLLQNNKT